MNTRTHLFVILAICCGRIAMAADFPLDTAKIDQAAGVKGTLNAGEGVYKVTYPRGDVKVSVDGPTMPAFMGLASWAAFMPGTSKQAMVMGDTVLFQDEVNPAMSVALENGLAVPFGNPSKSPWLSDFTLARGGSNSIRRPRRKSGTIRRAR
jgi:hypothetical protein